MDRNGSKSISFIVDNYDYAMSLAKNNKQVLKYEIGNLNGIDLNKTMEILSGLAGNSFTAKAQSELDSILAILKDTNSKPFYSGQEAGRHIHDTQNIVKALEEVRAGINSKVDSYRAKVTKYNSNLSAIKAELNK